MVNPLAIKGIVGKTPLLVRLLFIIFVIVFVIGIVIHALEPEVFPTLFDGIWWAIVTISTVGYGDFVPYTLIGRLLGIVLIMSGVGFMTFYVTTLAATTIKSRNAYLEGKLHMTDKDHHIIIGWNERSRHAIDRLLEANENTTIVLIDETLEELPSTYRRVHFVRGNSTEDAILQQANVREAASVLITAKHQGSEFSADSRSILTTLAVKSINPHVYTVVEILTEGQIVNATRAGADEVVESTALTGAVLTNGLLHHNMSKILDRLLTEGEKKQLFFYPIPEGMIGKTFDDYFQSLYESDEGLAIGLKRVDRIHLYPPKNMLLLSGDEVALLVRTESHL
ncbi:potassium channel family protein [Halalkalibacterium halodurans]|uniref:potassium channel family protein n=1 Tax=Halalkalibacterium halodurans TaxID=86665 RepID=UPI0010FD994B|nr:potassium channel family protein [Halalkalibacterium halodurans]